MTAMIATMITILLFVPWLLIVLIPLGGLLLGGYYCFMYGAESLKSNKICEDFEFQIDKATSTYQRPIKDYISI